MCNTCVLVQPQGVADGFQCDRCSGATANLETQSHSKNIMKRLMRLLFQTKNTHAATRNLTCRALWTALERQDNSMRPRSSHGDTDRNMKAKQWSRYAMLCMYMLGVLVLEQTLPRPRTTIRRVQRYATTTQRQPCGSNTRDAHNHMTIFCMHTWLISASFSASVALWC
jgi:hypothetical protein